MWQKAPKIASQSQKRPQNQAPTRLRAAWMPRTLPRWTTMNAKNYPRVGQVAPMGRRPPLAPVRRWGRNARAGQRLLERSGLVVRLRLGKRRTHCMMPKCMPISRAMSIRSMANLATWSCSMGTAAFESMDIAAVLDGSYDVYIPMFVFNYQHLKSVTFPQLRHEGMRAPFTAGRKGDLTSVAFEISPDGSGRVPLRCIYRLHRAFLAGSLSCCRHLQVPLLGILPGVVVKLRIDNPDVCLAQWCL